MVMKSRCNVMNIRSESSKPRKKDLSRKDCIKDCKSISKLVVIAMGDDKDKFVNAVLNEIDSIHRDLIECLQNSRNTTTKDDDESNTIPPQNNN